MWLAALLHPGTEGQSATFKSRLQVRFLQVPLQLMQCSPRTGTAGGCRHVAFAVRSVDTPYFWPRKGS